MSLQNAHQPEGAKERRSGDARAADTDTPASLQTGLRDPAEENSGGTELVTSHMDIEASSEEMDRTASGGPLREIPSADRGRSMRGKEGATSHMDKDARSEDRTASDGPLSEIPSADRGRSVRGKEVVTSRTDKEASSEEMDRRASGGPLDEIPSADRGRSVRGKEYATSRTDKEASSEEMDRTASCGPLDEIPSADRGRSERGKDHILVTWISRRVRRKWTEPPRVDPSERYPLRTEGDR
jgi:hypothetical protein